MLTDLLSILSLSIAFLALWIAYCNHATWKHRSQLLNEIFDNYGVWDASYSEKMDNYLKVSYNTHMFRLVRGNWNWRSWYYETE
jgi:hypothetical protein